MSSKQESIKKDLELVGRCASGDEDAWDRLIRDYGRLIYCIAGGYAKRRQEIDDIFIFVVEKLWKNNAGKLTAWSGKSRFSGYLSAVVSNLCADYLRQRIYKERERYQPLDEERMEAGVSPRSETQRYASRRESRQLAEELVNGLPEGDRRILSLFYWQGRSYSDISSIMQIKVNEVGKRLLTARRQLKTMFARLGIKNLSDILE